LQLGKYDDCAAKRVNSYAFGKYQSENCGVVVTPFTTTAVLK
jgi:hypothetical protein